MKYSQRIIQYIVIALVQLITLLLVAIFSEGLQIQSLAAAIGVAAAYVIAQVVYWWLFINFFSWLPVWLYPLLTFILTGGVVMLVGNLIPGIEILSIGTGIWIAVVLTAVNAVLGSLLSLDVDSKFDNNVTRKLVERRGKPITTTVPGFLFLEIDGLGEKIFQHALDAGHMPTLKRWLDRGTHRIMGWETDFTAQTGAMQTGILMGSNDEVPAYRWWDRQKHRIVMSGDPRDAVVIERGLSSGRGLLSEGGASRGNMFSGDASESLFTFGTLLDRTRGSGPGFYLYLVSPFVIARLFARFLIEVVKEWWQAWQQKRRKDPYAISARNPGYAFFRAIMGPFLQDLITYTVISDVLRGLPAVYALYAGYDDLGHFAGMESPEAYEALEETDHYFARIERALQNAPRPYHVVVLSDHGQSTGPTFHAAHGLTLEQLVKGLTGGDNQVYASLDTQEAWDNLNAFLSESINANTRTARVLRTMLRSKTQGNLVAVGPERNPREAYQQQDQAEKARMIVLASGCSGLIYFSQAGQRMTYEEIQGQYPDLIPGLVKHPGIGFLLVRSSENGDLVLGKEGIYFLDQNTYEGKNPLGMYGTNAPAHLKRESGFANCPDLIINTSYDPETEELCGFENQVSHHGGLGGPQSYPFIFYPAELRYDGQPLIGATSVYRMLRGWRDTVQGTGATSAAPILEESDLLETGPMGSASSHPAA